MIKSDEPSLRVLQELLTICHDSGQGYEAAADDVPDPELRRLFEGFAAQRRKFAAAIVARIRTLRETPRADGPSVPSALHRAWMTAKAATAAAQAHAVLAECARADSLALATYRSALAANDVDEQTHRLVQQQYEAVQAAHDRVQQLRDSAAYAYR